MLYLLLASVTQLFFFFSSSTGLHQRQCREIKTFFFSFFRANLWNSVGRTYEICFNEGNALHDGVVLYTTGRGEEWRAMTEENRQHLLLFLRVMLSIWWGVKQLQKKWKSCVVQSGKRDWLFAQTAEIHVSFLCIYISERWQVDLGNVTSISLTRPRRLSWGIWPQLWTEHRSKMRRDQGSIRSPERPNVSEILLC